MMAKVPWHKIVLSKTSKAAHDEAERQRETWEQQDRAAEARSTSNVMLANHIAQYQHFMY
jgi:hypothetical protein